MDQTSSVKWVTQDDVVITVSARRYHIDRNAYNGFKALQIVPRR
jgi:hypothetical protein